MSRRFSRNEKEKWVHTGTKETKRSPVRIPPRNNDNLIAVNKLTVIGRVTNPLLQRPRAVIDFLPQIWNLEGRVTGRELGLEKFQMRFESEADLEAVLNKGPYHYKKWMLLLQRWEPVISESFPSNISFWLKVHDLPLHYWDDITLNAIGKELGDVTNRFADDARVRVNMNGLLPLTMTLEIHLPSDEITTVEFEYLKIEKHCFTCFSLFHEEIDCPVRPRNSLPPKERKLGITQRIALQRIEADKKKHDDRRGYSRHHLGSRPYQHHDEHSDRRSYHPMRGDSRCSPLRRDETQHGYHRYHTGDRNQSDKGSGVKELSSGKILGDRHDQPTLPPVRGSSGVNTSKNLGSQSSHTPPPRPIRERLDYPNEVSSERTLSTSRERRSALARIAEPDLRDNLSRSSPHNLETDNTQGRMDHEDGLSQQNNVLASGPSKRGSTSAPRVSATLRIQEPQIMDNVNITIPPTLKNQQASAKFLPRLERGSREALSKA